MLISSISFSLCTVGISGRGREISGTMVSSSRYLRTYSWVIWLSLIFLAVTMSPRALALNSASWFTVFCPVNCCSISSKSLSLNSSSSSLASKSTGLIGLALSSSFYSSMSWVTEGFSESRLMFCMFLRVSRLARVTCFLSSFMASSDRFRFSNRDCSQ